MGQEGKFREGKPCNLRSGQFSWDIFLRITNKRTLLQYSDVVLIVHGKRGREEKKNE